MKQRTHFYYHFPSQRERTLRVTLCQVASVCPYHRLGGRWSSCTGCRLHTGPKLGTAIRGISWGREKSKNFLVFYCKRTDSGKKTNHGVEYRHSTHNVSKIERKAGNVG